jgi:hypothetical protein
MLPYMYGRDNPVGFMLPYMYGGDNPVFFAIFERAGSHFTLYNSI